MIKQHNHLEKELFWKLVRFEFEDWYKFVKKEVLKDVFKKIFNWTKEWLILASSKRVMWEWKIIN